MNIVRHPNDLNMFNTFNDLYFSDKVRSLFISKGLRPNHFNGHTDYKGKIIFWDEDYDARIMWVIDSLEILYPDIFSSILYIHESKGALSILLSKPISHESFEFLSDGISVEGDYWSVEFTFIYE